MEESLFLHPEFYNTYTEKTDVNRNIGEILEEGMRAVMMLLKFVSPDKAVSSYAEGKWTVKQLFGHMIDTERIMAYRALCFSRGEKSSLPGFEENDYVQNANFNEQNIGDLLEHYKMQRYANILLSKSFNAEMLNRKGIANGKEVNVRSLMYIIAGHELHHLQILKERYNLK